MSQLRVRYFSLSRDVFDVTGMLLSVSWEDQVETASPQFTFRFDNYQGSASRFVRAGGVMVVDFGPVARRWREWHRGTVVEDNPSASPEEQEHEVRTFTPVFALGQSQGKWAFKDNLTASQSISSYLQRLRLPVAYIEDTKEKIGAFTHEGTLWEAFTLLLHKTFKASGKRYTLEMIDGKLYLFRYEKPVWAYNGRGVVRSIRASTSIEESLTKIKLFGSERLSQGKNQKPLTRPRFSVGRANAAALRGFGLIEVTRDVEPGLATSRKMRKQQREELKKGLTPKREVEIELPFECLTIRRLQMITFPTVEPATRVKGRYVINAVRGEIAPDSASMTLTAGRRPLFPEAPGETEDEAERGEIGQVAAVRGSVIGTPGAGSHSYHAWPHNWQSDNAVDIALPVGTQLYAIEDGVVSGASPGESSGRFEGAKFTVVGANRSWYYAHLSALGVTNGQRVQAGDPVGASGSANGVAHLHIAVTPGENPVKLLGYGK